MDDILRICPPPLPYSLDDKIFIPTDEEGNVIGEAYSYNDWLQEINNISGISPELQGYQDDQV